MILSHPCSVLKEDKQKLEKMEQAIEQKIKVFFSDGNLATYDTIMDYVIQEFRKKYHKITNRDFDKNANNGEADELRKLIINYIFGLEEDFLNSPLLDSSKSKPSIDKGNLIMGSFGCGKTSITTSIKQVLSDKTEIHHDENRYQLIDFTRFRQVLYTNTNDFVDSYEESLRYKPEWGQSPYDKINNAINSLVIFDDLFTERKANNYGEKFELMRYMLERMEYSNSHYIIICNYYGSYDDTLNKIAQQYGERAYDRLFSSLNHVTLKGKSQRL